MSSYNLDDYDTVHVTGHLQIVDLFGGLVRDSEPFVQASYCEPNAPFFSTSLEAAVTKPLSSHLQSLIERRYLNY